MSLAFPKSVNGLNKQACLTKSSIQREATDLQLKTIFLLYLKYNII